MPAKSEKQLKLIFAIRNKYKSESKTPDKWKWVWNEEWTHLAKESHIYTFQQFNESMATLSNDDNQEIEDLCLYFSEKWKLSFETHFNHNGYISIQRFDKFHIQFSIQLNSRFSPYYGIKMSFYQDLNNLLNRIKKFGYNVEQIAWDSNSSGYKTFSFQISHTDEKSQEILKQS
jgi:hypothetical protein